MTQSIYSNRKIRQQIKYSQSNERKKKTKKNQIFNDNTLIVTVSKTDFTVLGVRYVSNTSNQHSITFNESENQAYHKNNWRRIVNEFLGAICVYSYVLCTVWANRAKIYCNHERERQKQKQYTQQLVDIAVATEWNVDEKKSLSTLFE